MKYIVSAYNITILFFITYEDLIQDANSQFDGDDLKSSSNMENKYGSIILLIVI